MNPYPNPPIREAVVDIRIDPLDSSYLQQLEELHHEVKTQFPDKKTRPSWRGTLKLHDHDILVESETFTPDGFLYSSADAQKTVQFRLNGFTYNCLKPYPPKGWPVVRSDAMRWWEVYFGVATPKNVSRIGLRYINEIQIPKAPIKLEEYLKKPPTVPDELPNQLEHFLTRVVIPYPFADTMAHAVITQSLAEHQTQGTTSIILDIDVLTTTKLAADTNSIFAVLDEFRALKNMIFKNSITSKTEELFR